MYQIMEEGKLTDISRLLNTQEEDFQDDDEFCADTYHNSHSAESYNGLQQADE